VARAGKAAAAAVAIARAVAIVARVGTSIAPADDATIAIRL
jgi:hypothetical protein